MNNRKWKKTKTIVYHDELNDDFNEFEKVDRPQVKENYQYVHKNVFIRIWDGFVYYIIGKPILGLYCLFHGIRYKNKKNLKKLKKQGAYIYSNHVAISDVFKFQSLIIHFKKVNIIGYSDASGIPVAKFIVKSLGYLPIPYDQKNMIKLKEACFHLTKKRKEYILIYPEAHIWPYYTKIRPFLSVSFHYPAESNTPIVPAVTIWRKVWYSKKPRQTVIFGQPIFNDPDKTVSENKKYLRDRCYEEMVKIANSYHQVEYIKYINGNNVNE